MIVKHKEPIWPEFYSESDNQFIAELVGDWLAENEHRPESFEWHIVVEWEE